MTYRNTDDPEEGGLVQRARVFEKATPSNFFETILEWALRPSHVHKALNKFKEMP